MRAETPVQITVEKPAAEALDIFGRVHIDAYSNGHVNMIIGPIAVFSLKLLFVGSGLTWQEKNYPIISNQSCCCRGQIAI